MQGKGGTCAKGIFFFFYDASRCRPRYFFSYASPCRIKPIPFQQIILTSMSATRTVRSNMYAKTLFFRDRMERNIFGSGV